MEKKTVIDVPHNELLREGKNEEELETAANLRAEKAEESFSCVQAKNRVDDESEDGGDIKIAEDKPEKDTTLLVEKFSKKKVFERLPYTIYKGSVKEPRSGS